MASRYREQEARVQQAVNAILSGQFDKIAPAAREFDVSYQRLRARLMGRQSRSDRKQVNTRLTAKEDAGLCQYLDCLDDLGPPARLKHLEAAANLLLTIRPRDSKDTDPRQVGQQWARRWMKRHADNLAPTRAVENARETRKKGGSKVTFEGGLLNARDARPMVRTREEKGKAQAERRAEKQRQRGQPKAPKEADQDRIQLVDGGAFSTFDITQ